MCFSCFFTFFAPFLHILQSPPKFCFQSVLDSCVSVASSPSLLLSCIFYNLHQNSVFNLFWIHVFQLLLHLLCSFLAYFTISTKILFSICSGFMCFSCFFTFFAPFLHILQSPPKFCFWSILSILSELQSPETVHTVSGFISLAKVSTSCTSKSSMRVLHSLVISFTGMRSQEPSST